LSFKNQGQPFQRFRESLTFEDIVKEQIKKCGEMMSQNDLQGSAAAVRVLVRLVTYKMNDQLFTEQMLELDEEWKGKMAEKNQEYQKRMKESSEGCPDLTEKPSELPGQDYWDDAFSICLDLFERRGLLMRQVVESPLS
jgi:hypothetical protein